MAEIINLVSSLISSVGFPVAATIVLFCLLNKETDAHLEESKGWQEVVANNTNALKELAETIKINKT